MSESWDRCPLCEASAWRRWTEVGAYTLVECQGCDLIATRPLPADEAVAALYAADDYYVAAERHPERARADAERRLSALHAVVPAGRLLEVGPGHGWFAAAAVRAGWEVTVLEPSPRLAEVARAVPGVRVVEERLEEFRCAERFDAVVAWEVVEHTPRPQDFLGAMARLTAPGGALAVSTPNFGGWLALLLRRRHPMVIPPEHLHYFRGRTLERWARRSGFSLAGRGSSSHIDAAQLRSAVSRRLLGRETTAPLSLPGRALFGSLAAAAAWADRRGWGTHLECVFQQAGGAA